MKIKTLGLFALSILTLVLFAGLTSAVTLSEWGFDDENLIPDIDITSDATLIISDNRSDNYVQGNPSSGRALSVNEWDVANRYLEISINTSGYGNLVLKFDEKKGTTNVTEFKIQYSSDGTTFINLSGSTTLTSSSFGINPMHTFDFSSITAIDNNVNTKLRITIPLTGVGGTSTGTWHIDNIQIEGTVTVISELNFCDSGTINDDDLTLKVDIENKGEGEDYEWLPLDTIEVEVELKNDKNVDLDDVIFEIGLFKEGSSNNIIDDMIWISDDDEEFEYGDIDENDDGKHTFEFRIDPDEVDSGDYLLMVKAYPQGEEDETCIDYSSDIGDDEFGSSEYYAEIEITKESDRDKMVVVDVSEIDTPIKAACGEQVVLSVDVWNIGNRDFEDQIMVSLYNSALGIDLKEVILDDLDEGDKAQVDFVFNVPADANEKQYTLSMRTYYDYDEGDGKYETDYDRKSEDAFHAYLKVEGNCVADSEDLLISASLESEAKAGKEMVIKSTITNQGDELQTFTINAAEFAAWADLISQDQNTLVLNAGQSRDVLFTFDVNKDASGSHSFTIELMSEDNLVTTQPVSVNIESARPFLGITGLVTTDNAYLWGIGILNIVLIVIIILIAVRIARRK